MAMTPFRSSFARRGDAREAEKLFAAKARIEATRTDYSEWVKAGMPKRELDGP
jgi:hypothetical protein